jgi:hypothetical protein
MEHPRRFLFRGNAAGVAAHIRRPVDRRLPVHACVSLPVIGGIAHSRTGPKRHGKWVYFRSTETHAHGEFEDAEAAVKMTRGEVPFDSVPTRTTVTAKVRGLEVLGRLKVGVIDAGLVSRSPAPGEQVSIQLSGNRLDKVSIDGHRLKITLEEDLFTRHDTKSKLETAYAGEMEDHHRALFFPAGGKKRTKPTFPQSGGMAMCTLVKEMTWVGKPHPEAKIDGHVLIVPEFGKVYFAEMVITHEYRRLSMVRVQLGSPDGGDVTGGCVETDGSFFPPSGG